MEPSWTIFAVMFLLGAVQLAVGVVLGRCLPLGRRSNGPPRCRPDAETQIDLHHLHFFVNRLCGLVAGVSDEVGDHRNQISEVNRELARTQENNTGALTDSVLRSIAQIVTVNERLQNRLESVEKRLLQQNEQIAAHFTESRTDPLTGLMNRRALDDALRLHVEQGSHSFALMMVDVDRFKNLNDEHGHPAGDQILRNISGCLEALLAGKGLVARYGGEEFAVIVPGVDTTEAQRIAERLRFAVATSSFCHERTNLALSVSLGVTLVAPRDDPMTGIERADEALYTAKRSGRNQAFFHDGKSCWRIAPNLEPSGLQAAPGASCGPPATPECESAPDSLLGEDNLDEISADLRRRMVEVAGGWDR